MKKYLFIVLLAILMPMSRISAAEVSGNLSTGLSSGSTINGVQVVAPAANVATGTYYASQTVSLTAAEAHSIRYTLTGADPSCSSGLVYSSALTINATTVLKAISCYDTDNSVPSAISTYTYTFACSTVSNAATYNSYPTCGPATCNSGYALSGSTCAASSSGSGGISGGGGGGGGGSTSAASASLTAGGGSVALAQSASSPSVKFTAPAGALAGATTVAISKVYTSSSTYVPPAAATGLFMVGGNVFQITAFSGGNSITNFAKPVTLTFTYTDAQIPAGVLEANLKIYYYDTVAKTWVAVASTVNPGTNTITATVDHLTQFAIYGQKTAGAAAVSADKMAMIAQIQALLNSLIEQLKAKIGEMIAKGEYVSPALMAFAPNATATSAANPSGKITQGWALGQSNEEIKIIQSILAKDAAIYPEGKITGYFGPATQTAVQKFQEKYGLAKPGDAGYGIVGPATRAKLNAM